MNALRRCFDMIRYLPLRIRLSLNRERFTAHPFDAWSAQCPMCGGTYDQHERAYLGSAIENWEEFTSAVENNDWDFVAEKGRSSDLIGQRDLLIAIALRCPVKQRIEIFLYANPYGVAARNRLISQQILGDTSARELLKIVVKWEPVTWDVLQNLKDMNSQYAKSKQNK